MGKKFGRIVIVGLGLIGGSVGLALKKRGAAGEIIGIDKDMETVEGAKAIGAVDAITLDPEEGLDGAELVILAVPLDALIAVLERINPYLPEGCIVTDVISVKSQPIKTIRRILPSGVKYIGGHPMAGSERSGIKAADPFLFENAIYILTPIGDEPDDVVEYMKMFIETLGAKPLLVGPERHDELVAMVSHLPHLVAASLNLAVTKLEAPDEALLLAAGGFRDTTRIASSHPDMWSGISLGNRRALSRAITNYIEVLIDFKKALDQFDRNSIKKLFEEAKRIRDEIPNRRGILPRIFEIIVTLPDRPGEIGKIGTLLGDNGINIAEIEILRVREGDGGTMRLAFSTRDDALSAQKVLEGASYRVRRRE